MASYLSPEWLEEFDEAVRTDETLREACADVQLVLQYDVANEGEPDVIYAIRFEPAGARVVAGPTPDADIVFSADRETASSIAKGESSAQRAVIDGRLTLTGATTALIGHRTLLDSLSTILQDLRATTTWS